MSSSPVAEEEGTTPLIEVTTDAPTVGSVQPTVGSDEPTVGTNKPTADDNQPTEIIVRRSFCAQIALSCFAAWCCFVGLFGVVGLVAFILAMVARCKEKSGKYQMAGKLAKASTVVSIVGIIVGFILLIVAIVKYNQ